MEERLWKKKFKHFTILTECTQLVKAQREWKDIDYH